MTSSNSFSFNSSIIGSKDELAVMIEQGTEQQLILLKNYQIKNLTISRDTFERVHTLNGETKMMPVNKHMELDLTIESIDWEMVTGHNLENELPDVVDDMTVEELLHAVNQKIEDDK